MIPCYPFCLSAGSTQQPGSVIARTAHHAVVPAQGVVQHLPARITAAVRMPPAIQVVPLGGLGEFGMNSMAVSTDATTMVIDAGVMFAGPDCPASIS